MKAMKFRVESPEHSKQIQERLFEMGYKWAFYNTKVSYEDRNYIYANKDKSICWGSCGIYFNNHENELTTLSDIMPWQPKQGEIIEVLGSKCGWYEREFLTMYKDRYVCKAIDRDDYTFFGYTEARQINPIRKEIERLKDRIKELEGRL